MVALVVVTMIIVASFVGAVVAVASWALSACILVESNFGLLSISVLIGGCDHLVDSFWWLTIKFGAEVAVTESADEGGEDFCFRDVGNRIPHLGKSPDVATEELGRFLVDAIQIMLGARPSTCSHVVVGEDLLQLFPGSDGVRGKACELVRGGWREHDGKIDHHDTSVSSVGAHGSGVRL